MSGNPDTLRVGPVGAAHGGAARKGGLDRTERRRDDPARGQPPLALQRIEDTVLDVFSEARTNESLFKPTEEQNPRLTSGVSPERKALFVPGCLPVYRRLFVSVNLFYARHVREPVAQSRHLPVSLAMMLVLDGPDPWNLPFPFSLGVLFHPLVFECILFPARMNCTNAPKISRRS